MQVPLPVQQPLHVDAQEPASAPVPPPPPPPVLPKLVQVPSEQDCVSAQVLHTVPLRPQALLVVPCWHTPAVSQQPWHVPGLHVVDGPHDRPNAMTPATNAVARRIRPGFMGEDLWGR